MDLSSLTPEELQVLREALSNFDQTPHADASQDQAQISASLEQALTPIAQIIEAQQAKIEAMDEEIDTICNFIQENLINKVKEQVEANQRMSGLADFKAKFGDKLNPFADAYSKIFNGSDIYEGAYDDLDEARGREDWTEGSEDSFVDGLINKLKAYLDTLKAGLAAAPEIAVPAMMAPDGKPAAIDVTVVKKAEQPSGETDIRKQVAAMKKSGIPGMRA